MAWPPPTLPTTRTNTTVMADTHPAEHNAVNLAINDIAARATVLMGYKTGTGNITITAGATDLTGLTVTVTTIAGHRYRIRGKANYQASSGTPSVETRIYEDGSSTIVDSANTFIPATGVSFPGWVESYRSPAAGTHTWKLTGNTAGTGVQFISNLSPSTFIVVEDVGLSTI